MRQSRSALQSFRNPQERKTSHWRAIFKPCFIPSLTGASQTLERQKKAHKTPLETTFLVGTFF
jgi:hypothetical protein